MGEEWPRETNPFDLLMNHNENGKWHILITVRAPSVQGVWHFHNVNIGRIKTFVRRGEDDISFASSGTIHRGMTVWDEYTLLVANPSGCDCMVAISTDELIQKIIELVPEAAPENIGENIKGE